MLKDFIGKKHNVEPMIIDIVDNFSVFPYQFNSKHIGYSDIPSHQEDVCLFDNNSSTWNPREVVTSTQV